MMETGQRNLIDEYLNARTDGQRDDIYEEIMVLHRQTMTAMSSPEDETEESVEEFFEKIFQEPSTPGDEAPAQQKSVAPDVAATSNKKTSGVRPDAQMLLQWPSTYPGLDQPPHAQIRPIAVPRALKRPVHKERTNAHRTPVTNGHAVISSENTLQKQPDAIGEKQIGQRGWKIRRLDEDAVTEEVQQPQERKAGYRIRVLPQ